MGAGQSSAADLDSQNVEVKTSYYELLAVERNATEDEIKKAYRRKALELHPDRNYGNVESATALFAEVQSAYEVLSDPQERAWYDSHESAILRGADPTADNDYGQSFEGTARVTSADDIARMIRRFNSRVEFTDAPSGFFGFLRETFEQLAKEEEMAARMEGLDARDYPSFGHKDDLYAHVVKPFYALWGSFATQKSFKWKDRYRLSEAPDRRYRRLMEKENQKFRDEGIREFNDAVRSLVAFIRKRDPRVEKTEQSEAERQKVLQEAAKAQAARARKRNEELLNQSIPEWAQVAQKDELEGEMEDSESEEEHFECVACRKVFKSEKQWEAHEKSKKHQKALHGLQRKMQKENKHLDLADAGADIKSESPTPASDDESSTVEPEVPDDAEDEKRNETHLEQKVDGLEIDSEEDDNILKQDPQEDIGNDGIASEQDDDDDDATSANSDYADISSIKTRLARGGHEPDPDAESGDDSNMAPKPKMGKAAQKRAKKAAAAAAAAAEGETKENRFKCGVCDAAFPSKRQMFQHIEDNGHALPKTVSGGQTKVKGKKSRR